MTKLKVVHLMFSLKLGGAENMTVDICNEQSKTALVTLIIIHNLIDDMVLDRLSPRVSLIRLNEKAPTKIPYFIFRLWLILWKIKPDILHLHNRMSLKLFPFFLPRFGMSITYTIHDTVFFIGREFYNANNVYSISNAVRAGFFNRLGLKTTVNYNGIPVNLVKKRSDWSFNKNRPFKILQISRLVHKTKGQHLLLSAAKILSDKGISLDLTFIGEGESRDHLIEMTKSLGIEEFVNFIGECGKTDIYTNIKNYDVLVQPSLYEGFGLTIAEAMAAKVPVIVSDIEGPLEIVDNGKYGLVFRSGDADDLVQKIESCIHLYQTNQIEETIKLAHIRVNKLFNITETSNRYLRIVK